MLCVLFFAALCLSLVQMSCLLDDLNARVKSCPKTQHALDVTLEPTPPFSQGFSEGESVS